MIDKAHHNVEVPESKDRIRFKIIKNVNESLVLADDEKSVCVLRWNGRVDIETATELLTLGAAAVMLKGYKKILVDRRRLLEFDTEARHWIDGWIKTKAKSVSFGIEKLAIINSDTSFGNIFNNAFNSTIAIVMPHLNIKKFSQYNRAMEWLLK